MYIIIVSLDIVSFDLSLCMYILQGSGITRNGIFNVNTNYICQIINYL